MDRKQYYTPPAQEIFDEIKQASIKLWETYDNEFGYVSEKTEQIKRMTNVEDNTCYIVAMFDIRNQLRLLDLVTGETKVWLKDLVFNNQT